MAAPSLSSGQYHQDALLAGVVPDDVQYEILLRLPAKDLCRLSAVCRPWRSLLSSPHFIANHAARHPEPLIVIGYDMPCYGSLLCEILDLSGRVVKRVRSNRERRPPGLEPQWVMCSHLDLICVAKGSGMSCQLLNLATGAVHALPEGLASEHAEYGKRHCRASTTFGLVPSTGQYKVLRLLRLVETSTNDEYRRHITDLYEVFSIGGNNQARWRGIQAPTYHVKFGNRNSAVIGGIVYFLLSQSYSYHDANKDFVASFDLEMEKWSASIRGPSGIFAGDDWYGWSGLFIAALSGCLVFCCRTTPSSMVSDGF